MNRSCKAAFLVLILLAAAQADEFAECDLDASSEEELHDLEVTLLQTSLTLAPRPQERSNTSEKALKSGIFQPYFGQGVASRSVDAGPYHDNVSTRNHLAPLDVAGLSFLAGTAEGLAENVGRSVRTHASFILQLVLPTDRTAVSGIPALLVFMLAAVVMVVFAVQLTSAFFEPKDSDPMTPHPGNGRYERTGSATHLARGQASHKLAPGRNPYAGPMFGPDGQELDRSTVGSPHTLPAMTLPGTARNSFAPPTPSAGAPQGMGSMFSSSSMLPGSSGSLRSQASRPDAAAMCPKLIMPHSEAQFLISAEDMAALERGNGPPVAVLGRPSGHALLHARWGSKDGGKWLELSTTATSPSPHCSVGPIRLGANAAGVQLDIIGPQGDRYGILTQQGGGWQLSRSGGQVRMAFVAGRGKGLSALVDGQPVASAGPEGSGSLLVRVSPGTDPLLALLCSLAITLLSPELVAH